MKSLHSLLCILGLPSMFLVTVVNAWTLNSIHSRYGRGKSVTSQSQFKRETKLQMAVSACFANVQGRELVERFGAVWEDEVEKIIAYETLQMSESRDQILDAAILYIQDTTKNSPVLAQKRWNIRFPSRRTTVGCFARILEEMKTGRITVDSNRELDNSKSESLDPAEVSRQNLNLLLELLSTSSRGVWGLEKDMMSTISDAN